jgi:hypothetical protein
VFWARIKVTGIENPLLLVTQRERETSIRKCTEYSPARTRADIHQVKIFPNYEEPDKLLSCSQQPGTRYNVHFNTEQPETCNPLER